MKKNKSESGTVKSPGRRLAIASTSIIGGAGLIATAVPFVAYMGPSEKVGALGGPVDVDLTGIGSGERNTVRWRGHAVFILRRTPEMLASLGDHDELLSDPLSLASIQPANTTNVGRSVKQSIVVLDGVCTHLGCVPNFRPVPGAEFGADWLGGFHCPCHGSKFDLAGRVFKGVPVPTNLTVPPYEFTSETSLRIGFAPQV